MKSFRQFAIILCFLATPTVWGAEPDLEAVKMRYDEYVALSAKFDVAVADFYSDEAVVRTDRHYPDGTVKTLQMAGKAWKDLMRQFMALAKERGDINTYAEAKVEAADAEKVKVSAQRTSKLKNYTTPISWLYAKSADGKWQIIEEQSVTKP